MLVVTTSTAFACVQATGKVTVDGDDADTVVVGKGNDHSYCSTGRPVNPAAGQLGDPIEITVEPGTCTDTGALATHQMPEGLYEVRYNNNVSPSYTYSVYASNPSWNLSTGSGCWAASSFWVSILGTFNVDANGHGSWSGSLDQASLSGPPSFATPLTASNLCVGESVQSGPTRVGMLTPYQLLVI